MSKSKQFLGVDVGGSGIKGALVDVSTGKLLTERLRVDTPQPATPKNMTIAFKELVSMFKHKSEHIGVGFPAIVRNGVAKSAANIDPKWIDTSVAKLWGKAAGAKVHVLNDADAAGVASISYGSGMRESGVVVFLTIGTGIGSALFVGGKLIPNSELGHIYMPNGKKSEHYASNKTRKDLELDYDIWGKRFNEVLLQIDRILSPDLILLGGGMSKRFELFSEFMTVDCPVKPAQFRNEAGAIGAAIYAAQQAGKSSALPARLLR